MVDAHGHRPVANRPCTARVVLIRRKLGSRGFEESRVSTRSWRRLTGPRNGEASECPNLRACCEAGEDKNFLFLRGDKLQPPKRREEGSSTKKSHDVVRQHQVGASMHSVARAVPLRRCHGGLTVLYLVMASACLEKRQERPSACATPEPSQTARKRHETAMSAISEA